MFEEATNNGVTQRLRQDMNPGVVKAAEQVTAPPIQSSKVAEQAAAQPIAQTNDLFVPEVEAPHYVLKVRDTKTIYLTWLALLIILPTSFFWLVSFLYTLGARSILVSIVSRIPFSVIVGVNVLMPIASAILGGFMVAKTEPDTGSRLIAKVAILLACLCLAALAFWLAFEAF